MTKYLLKATVAIFILAVMYACGRSSSEKNSTTGELSEREQNVRLQQYKVQGMTLYQAYCANCHGKEGEGLAKLFPPLAKSDYLMSDLERAACIIKNGQKGEIVVNGVTYNQMMSGLGNLDPIEIAEIVTYISNSWGNEAGLTSTTHVSKWLEKCGS